MWDFTLDFGPTGACGNTTDRVCMEKSTLFNRSKSKEWPVLMHQQESSKAQYGLGSLLYLSGERNGKTPRLVTNKTKVATSKSTLKMFLLYYPLRLKIDTKKQQSDSITLADIYFTFFLLCYIPLKSKERRHFRSL